MKPAILLAALLLGLGSAMAAMTDGNSGLNAPPVTVVCPTSGTTSAACVKATAIAPTPATLSVASSAVLLAGPGYLNGVQVNSTSAAVWVLLFNATSAPSNGAVTPVKAWQIGTNQTLAASWAGAALQLGIGITVACSTTGPTTLTLSGTCTFSGEVFQ